MTMRKIWLVVLLLGLVVWLGREGFSQEGCSRPRVLVRGEVVDQDAFEAYLRERYPHQPVEALLSQIHAAVLAELRENSPEVEFVEEGDFDYRFSYILSLIAAGEDIEVGGVLVGEHAAFWMSSVLSQGSACGLPGWVLGVKIVQDDPDVFRTVERNIEKYGSIASLIEEFERTHRVPPRGPKMAFTLTGEYVSPKLEEREMDIRVRVTSCRDEPVFDRHHGQMVILPRRTERGELKPTEGFSQDFVVTENQVFLFLTHAEGGSVTYTLKRGMDLDLDLFQAETCGIDKVLVEDVIPPVPIAGVVLEVEPQEVYIYPGSSTTIEVRLWKETPSGKRIPLAGEFVEVEAQGLLDGSLKPRGRLKTDGEGKARLTYKAGYKEEGVVVVARYKPEGYPESIEEKTSVALVEEPACWRGKVDIVIDFLHQASEKSNPMECGRSESECETEIHAHVWGELILRPGGPDEVISQDFSGTYRMEIRTLSEACVTYCRKKGVKGEVPVRPGNREFTESVLRARLSEKDFRVFANLSVDRKAGTYRFSCGFEGLFWKGFVESRGEYYSACTGETRREQSASQEVELERFDFSSSEFEGQVLTRDKVHGEKQVEYLPYLGGTVKYTWDFERIPCKKRE